MSVWVTEHSCISLSLQQQNLYYKYETRTKKPCYRSTENTLERHSLIWHLRSSRPISLLASMQSETYWLPPWNVGEKKKREREREEEQSAGVRPQVPVYTALRRDPRSEIFGIWELVGSHRGECTPGIVFFENYISLLWLLSTFHLPPLHCLFLITKLLVFQSDEFF